MSFIKIIETYVDKNWYPLTFVQNIQQVESDVMSTIQTIYEKKTMAGRTWQHM